MIKLLLKTSDFIDYYYSELFLKDVFVYIGSELNSSFLFFVHFKVVNKEICAQKIWRKYYWTKRKLHKKLCYFILVIQWNWFVAFINEYTSR